MPKNCQQCRHCDRDWDGEDHHITSEWFTCSARPNIENLKQFPFQKTNCASFTQKHVTQ